MRALCLATPEAWRKATTACTPFRSMPLSGELGYGAAQPLLAGNRTLAEREARCSGTTSFDHLVGVAIVLQVRSGTGDLLQRVEARLLLAAQRGIELVQGGLDQLGGRQHGPSELTSSFGGRTDTARTCRWLDPVANGSLRTRTLAVQRAGWSTTNERWTAISFQAECHHPDAAAAPQSAPNRMR